MQLRSHAEPRSRFVARFTASALRDAGLCIRKFSTRVADEYLRRVAQHERCVHFHTGNGTTESSFKAEKRNAQIVQRFIDGVVKFPADLEESWVSAFPDEYRDELVRELAARYGLTGTRSPISTERHPITDLAATLRDAGDVACSLSPLFANGTLNTNDIMNMRFAMPQIARAIADLSSLQAQIANALESAQKPTLRAAS